MTTHSSVLAWRIPGTGADRNGKFALEVIKSRNCLYLSVSMVLGGLSIPCPCCVLL